MRLKIRLGMFLAFWSALIAPFNGVISAAQQRPQQPQAPEAFVARVRQQLDLNDDQTAEFRKILAKRMQKITELRNRSRNQPYSPLLQAEVEAEQTAMKEDLTTFLSKDQKDKLVTADLRPVPPPPPFIPIEITPRTITVQLTAGAALPAVAQANKRPVRLTEDQRILHLLNRATFGTRPGDFERARQIGFAGFLEEQLHPESIDDSEVEKRLAALPTQRLSSAELYNFYPPGPVLEQRMKEKNPQPVFGRPQQMIVEMVQQKLVRAVSSNRQLQEVMTDFWFNHFNVFANKEADQWLLTSYERDVIRPRALGKFSDLLLAVAESPAMLFYLDNWLSSAPESRPPGPPPLPRPPGQPQQPLPPRPAPAQDLKPAGSGEINAAMTGQGSNSKPDNQKPEAPKPPQQPPARRPGINENFARELMELHSMGVDGGYTQKDVQELARCLTGWTIDRPFQGGPFVFRAWAHDTGAKMLLGSAIPAGGGISDGYRAIEILSRHPSTARFISRKLCQRFVSDNPPDALIERVARVFARTDGDMREVLRTVFNSPEFNSAAAFRSKVKSPLELAASAIRAVDGDTNGAPALHEWLRRMGEPLYQHQAPTGYGEDSSRWVNSGAFLTRLNFAVALASNQIPGTRFDQERLGSAAGTDMPEAAVNRLAAMIVHTELSQESRNAVRVGLAEGSKDGEHQAVPVADRSSQIPGRMDLLQTTGKAANARLAQLIGLLIGTAEFQRR